MASRLQVGDLVWAKLKSFPYWPGKIIEPKPDVKKPKKDKNVHFVFFYGPENYAWVTYEMVCSYIGNKEKFMLRTRVPKGFREAIEAIDDAVKALPEEDRIRAEDLPSIDEELSKIFASRPAKSLDTDDIKKDPTLGKKALQDLHDRLSSLLPKQVEEQTVAASKESFCNSLKLKARKSEGDAIKPKRTRKSSVEVNGSPEKPKRRKRLRESTENGTDGPSPKKTPKIFKHKRTKEESSKKKSPIKPMKTLTPSEKILKKAKAVATVTASPHIQPKKHLSPGSPAKLKPRKIPDLSRLSEGDFSSLMPFGDYGISSGTQSDTSLLAVKSPVKSVIPTPMRIGFLGLGIMGQGMVMNLLRSGHEVTVWNRTSLKCRDFVKAGALKGNSPSDVVQSCDITFCCVADTTAVKDIVFGSSGVLKGISVGKCFVEMSTIDEETVQDVAEAIQARGGVYLEAPVVGSRVPALEGQLTVLASGDRKLFDDCFSCFEAIGQKSFYLGSDPGAATRMKLIINMIMGTVVASLAEGMAMAEKVGLDQEDVAEVLSIGSLSCPTINHKAQAILNQKYDPHFPLQHQQKDLRLSLQLGDKVEQPLYVAAAANELYKKARRLGYGDSDMSAVFRAAAN